MNLIYKNKERILYGILLLIILTGVIKLGKFYSLALLGIIGVLALDEIFINFYSKTRKSKNYVLSQIIFLSCFIYFNFFASDSPIFALFQNLSIFLNIFLVILLFYPRLFFIIKNHYPVKYLSFTSSVIVLFPFMSISKLFHYGKWEYLLIAVLMVTYITDMAAWFIGSKWGKTKLWPEVSPNKTVEGALGGIMTSAIITSIFWYNFTHFINLSTVIIMAFIALCSLLGDLVQSRIKRYFKIKDSSSLIPGHGGVYDRIDSLLLAGPIFVSVVADLYPWIN